MITVNKRVSHSQTIAETNRHLNAALGKERMADGHRPLLPDSARFNRLGGAYQNGKPLPKWLRREIIELAQSGLRQCDISRRLRITHGCISKILSKYQRTGHFEPGREYAARLRIIATPRALRTDEYMQDEPGLFSWETRRYRLRQKNLCREGALHSLSSIRRSLLETGTVGPKELGTSQEQGEGRRSHMIANILNLSSNEQSTTTSNESQPRQQSERLPHTALSRDLSEGAYFPLPIKKRKRIKYTSQQLGLLEAAFEKSKYLTPSIEKRLARDTGVITTKIQVWFSNRRAKEKKASVTFCADSNTQSPQGGIGNRYPDFLVPPPRSVTGRSRIFFPPGQV